MIRRMVALCPKCDVEVQTDNLGNIINHRCDNVDSHHQGLGDIPSRLDLFFSDWYHSPLSRQQRNAILTGGMYEWLYMTFKAGYEKGLESVKEDTGRERS